METAEEEGDKSDEVESRLRFSRRRERRTTSQLPDVVRPSELGPGTAPEGWGSAPPWCMASEEEGGRFESSLVAAAGEPAAAAGLELML